MTNECVVNGCRGRIFRYSGKHANLCYDHGEGAALKSMRVDCPTCGNHIVPRKSHRQNFQPVAVKA